MQGHTLLNELPPDDDSELPPDSLAEEPDPRIVLGANLRKLRIRQGLSLERLSKASGVSRAMLSQIELGQSTPTITLLWKIARALDVPLSSLVSDPATTQVTVLRRSEAKLLLSPNGTYSSRALLPVGVPRTTDFHEIQLTPGGNDCVEVEEAGTTRSLVVSQGNLVLKLGAERHALREGDAIAFRADVPHEILNPGTTLCIAYVVTIHRGG